MEKNDLTGKAFIPQEWIEYAEGSIVSRQLTKNAAGNITLFAFAAGQQLSEHSAPFDAVIQILAGDADIRIGGTSHHLTAGQMIIMPADIPHAVLALTKFKMLLIMIKG